MFTVEMLPASYGDCLWVEYGDPTAPKRILIDGGIAKTAAAISARAQHAIDAHGQCVIELLVVSHVDIDHIDGIVKFLGNLPPSVKVEEVWFNGFQQLPPYRLGGPSGERLTGLFETQRLRWNRRWRGKAIAVGKSAYAKPVRLAGGITLTVMSPTLKALADLRPKYAEECEKAGLIPGTSPQRDRGRRKLARLGAPDIEELAQRPFKEDTAVTNGSSIAFLAEYGDQTCLFASDAFPSVIAESITQGLGKKRLQLDAFKLSHHGSGGNTSPELLELIQAKRYLISTNGAKFHHPHEETIARILVSKKTKAELCFNYVSDENELWGDKDMQRTWRYQARFPQSQDAGLKIELS